MKKSLTKLYHPAIFLVVILVWVTIAVGYLWNQLGPWATIGLAVASIMIPIFGQGKDVATEVARSRSNDPANIRTFPTVNPWQDFSDALTAGLSNRYGASWVFRFLEWQALGIGGALLGASFGCR